MNRPALILLAALLLAGAANAAQVTNINSAKIRTGELSTDGNMTFNATQGGVFVLNNTGYCLAHYTSATRGCIVNATLTGWRNYTLPDTDGTFLLGPAPSFTDYSSANHDHQDADDGGTLSGSAIASGTVARARLPSELAYEDEVNTFSLVATFDDGLQLAAGECVVWGTDAFLCRASAGILNTTATLSLGTTLTVAGNSYHEGAATFNSTLALTDFSQAQHDHGDVDDGGTLDASAIQSGTIAAVRLPATVAYQNVRPVFTDGGSFAGWVYIASPNLLQANGTFAAKTNSYHEGPASFNSTLALTDFTQAQHDHLDADDGGTLDAAAIASGTIARARLPTEIAYEDEANTFSVRPIFSDGLTSTGWVYIASPNLLQANGTFVAKTNSYHEGAAVFNSTLSLSDFTLAQHDHLDTDDAGTLSASAITSGTLTRARLPTEIAYEDEANTFSVRQVLSDGSTSTGWVYVASPNLLQSNGTFVAKSNSYHEGPLRANGTVILDDFTTNGAIPFFSGGNGQIATDNSNLCWDDTNNRLGINICAPTQALDIRNVGNGAGFFVATTQSGSASGPGFVFRGWDGAAASDMTLSWSPTISGFGIALGAGSPDYQFQTTGIVLDADNTYDLGSSTSLAWKNFYLDGSITMGGDVNCSRTAADQLTCDGGVVPRLVSGSTTSRTPVSGTPVTPSSTRPVFVTVQGNYNTATASAAGTLTVTCDGVASDSINVQNPLAAGTWNQDAIWSCMIPPGASYTATVTGTTWSLKAVETVM